MHNGAVSIHSIFIVFGPFVRIQFQIYSFLLVFLLLLYFPFAPFLSTWLDMRKRSKPRCVCVCVSISCARNYLYRFHAMKILYTVWIVWISFFFRAQSVYTKHKHRFISSWLPFNKGQMRSHPYIHPHKDTRLAIRRQQTTMPMTTQLQQWTDTCNRD